MGVELKLADFKIEIIEYRGESVKLKSLIDQAVTRGLIIYKDWNFLPYSINILQPDTDFFNLFLGFLAKPAPEINKEIMDPILCIRKFFSAKICANLCTIIFRKFSDPPQAYVM